MNNFLSNFNFKNIDSAATNLLTCPDQYISSYTIDMTSLTRTYDSISYNFDEKEILLAIKFQTIKLYAK